MTSSSTKKLEFAVPSWPGVMPQVEASVLIALREGEWGKYEGRFTAELAEKLATRFAQPLVTLCSSGTIAVELALRGLGVQPGQEVILGGYDFPGNFRAIESIGAIPVLVDLPPHQFAIDVASIEPSINDKTAAVIISHLHGSLAPMKSIMELARSRSISILEDACQCPGATIDGAPAGSFGDASVLSFGGSKLLSAGRGGAVLTRDDRVHQRIKIQQDRGNLAFPLSELQAAAVLPQLDMLDAFHLRRRKAAQNLIDLMRDVIELPAPSSSEHNSPDYYKFPMVLPAELRESQCAQAQHRGIPLFPGFRGFATRSSRRCRVIGSLHNSLRFATQIALLHHAALLLDDAELTRLASVLCSIVKE